MPETTPGGRSCLICERPLDPIDNSSVLPYNGTLFESQGHYGSTCYDPMDGSRLEFAVCDVCLTDRAARVVEVKATGAGYERAPWTPTQWTIDYVRRVAEGRSPYEDTPSSN